MKNFKNLPWKNEPYPDDYNGIMEICTIEWEVGTNHTKTGDGKRISIGIINNINVRGRMLVHRQKTNSGYITFLDMDMIPKMTAVRIINGYDFGMPVLLWCCKHKIDIPQTAIVRVAFVALEKVTGTMCYFNMDKAFVRRKRVSKRKKDVKMKVYDWGL